MTKAKLFRRILLNRKNVKFNDFTSLVEKFGFEFDRQDGSHHVYKHTGVAEILNLQNNNGEAKPYQIKQFLNYVEKYNIKMED